MSWIIALLITTLVLGISIAGLIFRKRLKYTWETIARFALIALIGTIIAAILMVLVVIAVWPPFNILSFVLTFGFLALVLGIVYFVRSTNTIVRTEMEAELDEIAILTDNKVF
ncbi:MAG: hypothetical protein ROZ36_12615 [Thermincola sp.]|nr:hypothetical protein [Thermincola sp.]